MKALKDFQDNWNVSYMKDFQSNWNVSYAKDFQDNWNVSYMKAMKDFQDNWNVSYLKAMKDFQDNWNISYMTNVQSNSTSPTTKASTMLQRRSGWASNRFDFSESARPSRLCSCTTGTCTSLKNSSAVS